MLRDARRYDDQSESIMFPNRARYTLKNFSEAFHEHKDVFKFCKKMSIMKVDNGEYALLTAIVIFSDRHGLKEPTKVEGIQKMYIDTLESYVYNHRAKQNVMFAKLLGVLTDLRSLAIANNEKFHSLKLRKKRLPKCLEEIWDIQR